METMKFTDEQYQTQLNKWSMNGSPCKKCVGNNGEKRQFHCTTLNEPMDRGRIIVCADFKNAHMAE